MSGPPLAHGQQGESPQSNTSASPPTVQVYEDVLYCLETNWMKSLLARRRWQRWYNAITAMRRMRRISASGFDSL